MLNVQRIDDYVKHVDEFVWAPGAIEALQVLRQRFARLIIVTNQQGVGKGLMTAEDLMFIHRRMHAQVQAVGVKFDAIYTCTLLGDAASNCRKPAPTMGHWAQRDFPEIDFAKSIMVGDSPSDMGFGESLGMYTVGIGSRVQSAQQHFDNLYDFSQALPAAA